MRVWCIISIYVIKEQAEVQLLVHGRVAFPHDTCCVQRQRACFSCHRHVLMSPRFARTLSKPLWICPVHFTPVAKNGPQNALDTQRALERVGVKLITTTIAAAFYPDRSPLILPGCAAHATSHKICAKVAQVRLRLRWSDVSPQVTSHRHCFDTCCRRDLVHTTNQWRQEHTCMTGSEKYDQMGEVKTRAEPTKPAMATTERDRRTRPSCKSTRQKRAPESEVPASLTPSEARGRRADAWPR